MDFSDTIFSLLSLFSMEAHPFHDSEVATWQHYDVENPKSMLEFSLQKS